MDIKNKIVSYRMQLICNNLLYTTKNKELQMFPLLHKTIETKPSNNLNYIGGLGKYNPLKSKQGLSNLYKIQINTLKMLKE
jgi:hypothetical protein